MSFSPGWNQRFASGGSQSTWPWSDLVSAVMRYAKPFPGMRVLELGCGVGANARLFLETGCDYYAVEGSEAAVEQMRVRLPDIRERVRVGDFTGDFGFEGPFDLIVDRSAVTHNAHAAIVNTLERAHDALRPGGTYIGIDWFSTAHADAGGGIAVDDNHTREDFHAGQFAGIGRVHFADEADMRALFAAFELQMLEHKILERRQPAAGRIATWNVAAQRTR